MIPQSRYNPRLADQLKEYLLAELSRARSDRQNLEKLWMRWHRMYRARPEVEHKTFPWDGAANIVVPLIGTNVDIVYARLMAMLFGPQNLWTCTPLRDDMVDFAPRLQEMLQWAQHNELGVYDAVGSFLLDLTKLGTGVIKTRYTRETKKVYEFREVQTTDQSPMQVIERQARILLKNHPSVHHVYLPNFFIPATANDIQSAPWAGERLNLTWSQYVNRVRAGIYTGIENVGQFMANSRGGLVERNMQTLDNFIPSKGDRFEPYEFWLDWDIDGDGEQEALVCTIHEESRSYLRIDFNPFFNQEKPYDFARYMKQENRFYGIGIAEMLDHFQEEITTMHNQRIDNTAVQTAQVLAYRKGGPIKQDTPIYPGAKIAVEDPTTDLRPLPLGNGMATSSIPNEQMSLSYAKDRVGVNDYISGGDDPSIGYGTATTAVQQLREGSKRFDQVLREVRQCLSGAGTKVAELYQQFNQRGKQYLVLGPKDGQMVSTILSFPLDLIRSGVNIDVTATSAAYNKEVEARTNMMIMQQLTQYYGQLLQYMQLIINPQLPPQLKIVAEQAAMAGSIMLRRLLDTYGTQDAERLVPDLQEAISGNSQQLGQLYGSLGANPGAAPMGQVNGRLNGVGALSAGLGGAPQYAAPTNGTGF
jgi:hypothetical protein